MFFDQHAKTTVMAHQMIGGTPEVQRLLFSGEMGGYMHDYIKTVAAPIYWQTHASGQWRIDAGGTCFCLLVENKPLLVTASHVYEGYLRRKDEVPHTSLSICNEEVNLEERLLSDGKDFGVDMATFSTSWEEVGRIGITTVSGLQHSWPPERVNIGDRIIFGGYPKIQRHIEGSEAHFGLNSVSCTVENVNEFGFSFQVPRDGEIIDAVGNGQQDYGASLGGISGARVWRGKE